jgi:hypothetical protein
MDKYNHPYAVSTEGVVPYKFTSRGKEYTSKAIKVTVTNLSNETRDIPFSFACEVFTLDDKPVALGEDEKNYFFGDFGKISKVPAGGTISGTIGGLNKEHLNDNYKYKCREK